MFLTYYAVRHCVWWGFAYCSWPRTWTRALAQHKLSISADFLHAKLNLYVISCLKFSGYNSLLPRSYSSVLSGQWGHFTRYQVPRFGTLEYRYSVLGTRYRPSLMQPENSKTINSLNVRFELCLLDYMLGHDAHCAPYFWKLVNKFSCNKYTWHKGWGHLGCNLIET